MMAGMGLCAVTKLKTGLVYGLSKHMRQAYDQTEYLATFSDELLAKSRRIDLLIDHTGTVGSYREELLRGLLQQILPRQYETSTGFIEGCARQIDILVWDCQSYAPLFREQHIVVVPRAAVRAAIEVKTTLDTSTLDEAMHILWDAFRREPAAPPVFKGIFAYELGYKSDLAVAKRMRTFYSRMEPDGIIDHMHPYAHAGITAVCVPKHLLIRERYRQNNSDSDTFPQPYLARIASQWTGDTKTPVFLGLLLVHLDLPSTAKKTIAAIFNPILSTMDSVDLCDIYPKGWRPCLAGPGLAFTLQPPGARIYMERVQQFFMGDLQADHIAVGLSNDRDSQLKTAIIGTAKASEKDG